MIKTVICDMGNVLMRFEPHTFIHRLGLSGEDEALLIRNVFRTVEWMQLDRNTEMSIDEAIGKMQSRLPERLHEAAYQLVKHWDEPLILIDGMEELVKALREAGYRILLLSNANCRQHEYWERIPASKYFDGKYLSCDHNLMKPEPAIYHDFLKWFDLKAEECVFIDDSPANIEAAIYCGIQGIIFYGDVEELKQNLRNLEISC